MAKLKETALITKGHAEDNGKQKKENKREMKKEKGVQREKDRNPETEVQHEAHRE